MTQPVAYDGVTVSKGTYQASYGTEAEATRFDFKFRFFVAPSGSGLLPRLDSFDMNAALPAEVVNSTVYLSLDTFTDATSIVITDPTIPSTFPQQGEAFISYAGEYRVIRWTSHSGSTFSGVTWLSVTGSRTLWPANSPISMWVDVTSYVGSESSFSTTSGIAGSVVTWEGIVSGEKYDAVLFKKGNFIAAARTLSVDPIAGTWGTEKLTHLGLIRSLNGHAVDSSGRDSFSIRIAGLLDWGKSVRMEPLAIGVRDIAAGSSVTASSTVLNLTALQNELRGDWVGITPTVDVTNVVDSNLDTFWASEGVPYEEFSNLQSQDYTLMIDEVLVNPDVGQSLEYQWIALWNPHSEKPTGGPGQYHIVVSSPGLQWASWQPGAGGGDVGYLRPYAPPGTDNNPAWESYPEIYYSIQAEFAPHSKVIVCKNATRFSEAFDGGGAQIIEIPNLVIPTTDAIIKVMWITSGVAPGTNPGDTIVYGTPTYTMPAYWTNNCPNPDPGYSLRRRFSGDLAAGGNNGNNFILDAHPTPGDTHSRKQREYIHVDLSASGIGLYNASALGTGPLTEIRFEDAASAPASTFKLDKSGSIKFLASSEIIQYSDNDGSRLLGITRGGTPENTIAGTEVGQMVGAQATYDVATSGISITTKSSGPVFGSIEIYGSKVGIGSPTDPPTTVPNRDDYASDAAYYTASNWMNDWDLLYSGPVYDHNLLHNFPVRRSRHFLVIINSMPVRTEVVSQQSGFLSGDIIVSSPSANLVGMGNFMRHGGISYTYDTISADPAVQGNYVISNVQPRSPNVKDVAEDKYVYIGQTRARMSNLSIYQANLIGSSGLMVGDGDTSVLFQYLMNRVFGVPNTRIVHIDVPLRVSSLVTSKGSITSIISDICRQRGLLFVEWPDMTFEIFGDPWRPVRNGYTDTVYDFGNSNSVRVVGQNSSPEDISQVEVTVLNPVTGKSHTARYPMRPYRTGAPYRIPDLVGDVNASEAFSVAAGVFNRLRNGRTVMVTPTGPADWLYPPMVIGVLEKNNSYIGNYITPCLVEAVSVSYSFGAQKVYSIDVQTRRRT